ncbi:hypothetical protein [Nonlabens agnitus]|nr:hypothetical protein [Nonlabens agnitus]
MFWKCRLFKRQDPNKMLIDKGLMVDEFAFAKAKYLQTFQRSKIK